MKGFAELQKLQGFGFLWFGGLGLRSVRSRESRSQGLGGLGLHGFPKYPPLYYPQVPPLITVIQDSQPN